FACFFWIPVCWCGRRSLPRAATVCDTPKSWRPDGSGQSLQPRNSPIPYDKTATEEWPDILKILGLPDPIDNQQTDEWQKNCWGINHTHRSQTYGKTTLHL